MAGAHIAIHAHQRRRAQQQEEQEMTPYTPRDLEGDWEFKIVRSGTGLFGRPDALQAVLENESRAGWTLVEKFDDQRIRLKRPAEARRRDDWLPRGFDPYRTSYGPSEARIVLGIVALCLLAGGLVFYAAYIFG